MRKFAAILLLLMLSAPFSAQKANEIHSNIRSAVHSRDYPAAIAELQNLETSEPSVLKLNNYDYLLARLHEKSGDLAAAMKNYQSVATRNSVLKEYALWHLSQIARSSGNLMLERIYLQELISFSPKSLLLDAAQNRIARSWFESKNYELSVKILTSHFPVTQPRKTAAARQPVENAVIRQNRLQLAQSYLYMGNAIAARENFTKLISNLANPAPPDDFALEAARGLDLLDVGQENYGKSAPALSDYEHLRRAQIYQFNRDFPDARLHYNAIINNHPASGNVPDAIYQIGCGYAQQGDFAEAINWFERVQQLFPEHPVCREALLQDASAYARLSKHKEAIARYQKYIQLYPDDERIDRAYLNIIDILRDQGEETEALKWAVKIQEVFKGKLPEAQALFAETRIYFSKSDWQNAMNGLQKLESLPELGGANVPGGTNKAEATFLKGFALEQMRRYAEAIDAYLSIPDGRNEYYGFRATERLKLLANDESAKPHIDQKISSLSSESKDPNARRRNIQAVLRLTHLAEPREKLLEDLKKVYESLPAYKKIPKFKVIESGRKEVLKQGQPADKSLADELLFLGLYDEAAPELKASTKNTATQTDDLSYTLAVFYNRGDMSYRAITFAEPLWRNIPADYQVDLIPREQIQLLYPAPYADALLKFALPDNVDPRFLLSIMRQESRFRPDVKSYAAARGLMQFISTTANEIAGALRRENFRQDDLYDPATAILFGSRYTANLFKMFPNQPQAVSASYNGGEDNMKRWLGRAKSDLPDRYVPEIAFSQSKDYVYKVMANYRVYQMLYDENLKAK